MSIKKYGVWVNGILYKTFDDLDLALIQAETLDNDGIWREICVMEMVPVHIIRR